MRVPQKRQQLVEALKRVNHQAVLGEIDVPIPEAEAPGVDDPLLDTWRSLYNQIVAYKRHDLRSG